MQRNWCSTYTGGRFSILDPDPADVRVRDIAFQLSRASRFGGATTLQYSVGEHCCRGAELMERPEDRIHFLLHDAAEAYTADIPSPYKDAIRVQTVPWGEIWLSELEDHLLGMIYKALQIPPPDVEQVGRIKQMDLQMLTTEATSLLIMGGRDWTTPSMDDLPPPGARIVETWRPNATADRWLKDYTKYRRLAVPEMVVA